MAATDTFEMASLDAIEFPYVDRRIRGSLDHHIHKYYHRRGGEVESLARHLYEIHFTCEFHDTYRRWRNTYPERLSQIVERCESGKTYPLVVPGIGTFKVKAIDWTRNLTAKIRSGEKVEFVFLETMDDAFDVPALVSARVGALPFLADQIRTDVFNAGYDPGILDKLLRALAAFQGAIDTVGRVTDFIAMRVQGILDACEALSQLPAFKLPVNAPMIGTLFEIWGIASEVQNGAMLGDRPVDTILTNRPMTLLDLSVELYADTAHMMDLLALNSFEDGLRIPSSTIVRFYL